LGDFAALLRLRASGQEHCVTGAARPAPTTPVTCNFANSEDDWPGRPIGTTELMDNQRQCRSLKEN
jgi:hypothetical protein